MVEKNDGRKVESTDAAVAPKKMNWEKYHEHEGNTWAGLLTLRKRATHKLPGFLYILLSLVHIYILIFRFEEHLKSGAAFSLVFPILGFLIAATAAWNFELPRNQNNAGMFKDKRTMSRSFVIENMYFQLLLGATLLPGVPLLQNVLTPGVLVAMFFVINGLREVFPKTSYTDWEIRENDPGFTPGQRQFVNVQVRIVRWNFVWKNLVLFYFWAVCAAHLVRGKPIPLSTMDYLIYHMLVFDALLNITVAIFLQTLKFKGFISALTFSVAFNSTVLTMGLIMSILFTFYHNFLWPSFLFCVAETAVNLYVVYPSKISNANKARCKTLARSIAFLGVLAVI